MTDREKFIGVKIIGTGRDRDHYRASFSVAPQLLAKLGKHKKVTIRGTPENGYLIAVGTDIKPSLVEGAAWAYITITADKVNMPRDARGYVWLRAEVEGGHIRIPPLPSAWISGDPEFLPGAAIEEGNRIMSVPKNPGDDGVRHAPSSTRQIVNGNGAANGNGSGGIHGTAPVAKTQMPNYALPEGTSMVEAQQMLAHKLEEARAIIRELEKRTGMRFTLSRAFALVVDLSGR